MRHFLAGNNTDSTAAVKAYLLANNQYMIRDLILIGEQEDPAALFLTDHEAPLLWSPWGTFLPGAVKRERKVASKVGLSVSSLTLEWKPIVTAFSTDTATANPIQLARTGWYDGRSVRIWRTVMPTPGDANTYGACEWFGGWVGKATTARNKITFTIDSFLNVLNQKLPPNTIGSSGTLAGYLAGAPVLADSETNVPTFTAASPSSNIVIMGDCIQPTANKIYGSNKFTNGYMVFIGGTLKGYWSVVATNADFNAGGGVHHNRFQVYSPFPWDPAPGDTFFVATQPPINLQDATAGPYNYNDFPFLPDPEANL